MSAVIAWALANPRTAATYAVTGALVLALSIALGVSRVQLISARAEATAAVGRLADMTTQRDVAVRAAQDNADAVKRVTDDKADADRRLAIASADLIQARADQARSIATIRQEIDHAVMPTDCVPSAALRTAHAGARRLLDAARAGH